MIQRLTLVILALAVFYIAAACTSSSTPTNVNTSSNYDQRYREPTRESRNYGSTGNQQESPDVDAPITIMLMATETGAIHPGEDYYVYAVVDNPDNKDIEYVWSVSNGEVMEAPEADRARLHTLVEEEYLKAAPEDQQPATPESGGQQMPAGQQAETGGQTAPGSQQPAPNAGLPGTGANQQSGQNGAAGDSGPATQPDDPFANRRTEGGGAAPEDNGANAGNDQGQPPEDEEMLPPDEYFGPDFIEELNRALEKSKLGEPLTPDETQMIQEFNDYDREYQQYLLDQSGNQASTFIKEQRHVAAADQDDDAKADNEEEITAEEIDAGITTGASADDDVDDRAEPTGQATIVETPAVYVDRDYEDAETGNAPRGRSLRSNYKAWQEVAEAPRRRDLGIYGEGLETTEPLGVDDSYIEHTYVTDEPFIRWTPRNPGDVNIYVKIQYKGEDITEPMMLPVTVTLREPAVELTRDFPDIVREDEPVYLALDGKNIPAFHKGLFTLLFDINKLSFREAELGDFFENTPAASLYYAQPNKDEGRVLLAIDSNTEIAEVSGDGVLAYLKFTAKQDLESREETGLAMEMDTSARYILTREGENVLPVPVEPEPFRSSTTMPPELPGYTRELQPGSEAAQGSTGSQQAGTNNAAAQGNNTGGSQTGTQQTQPGNNQQTTDGSGNTSGGSTIEFGSGAPSGGGGSYTPPTSGGGGGNDDGGAYLPPGSGDGGSNGGTDTGGNTDDDSVGQPDPENPQAGIHSHSGAEGQEEGEDATEVSDTTEESTSENESGTESTEDSAENDTAADDTEGDVESDDDVEESPETESNATNTAESDTSG
jgi:hypothetical protein